MRVVAGAAVALALAGGLASGGHATWSVSASGQSAAKAQVLPVGGAPSATAAGSSVTVTWPQSKLATGEPVTSYLVRRYDSVTGNAMTTLAGCAGTITALTCTETGVPAGVWRYRVTPVIQTWRGTESAASASVTVLV